jgi:hypothetical protein
MSRRSDGERLPRDGAAPAPAPAASTAANGSASPSRAAGVVDIPPPSAPHIYANVTEFLDVFWIYLICFGCIVVFLACQFWAFLALIFCDHVRWEALTALGVYMAITFTTLQPPLPFHLTRSYGIPVYLAFLFCYQQAHKGSFEDGLVGLRAALADPRGLAPIAALRFAAFAFVVVFAVVRLAGFAFLKSHNLRPGEKPRVMLTSDGAYPSIHGVVTFHTSVVKRLIEEGYPCHIVTGSPALEAKDKHQILGVPTTRLPTVFTPVGPQTPLGLPHPITLTQVFAYFRPHIVHVIEPGSALNAVVQLICWMLCIPVVVSHHTLTMEYRFSMSKTNPFLSALVLYFNYRTVMGLADLHVVTTKILMDTTVKDCMCAWQWWRVRSANGLPTMFWPTGSSEDFDLAHRDDDMRMELSNGNPDACVIVHVGRFGPEKNIMEFLPVALCLCDEYGDKVQFALVGWGT